MSKQLKVVCLALMAVLAIGALSASAAQAAPKFTVEGVASGSETLAESVTVTKFGSETTPSLTLTVPKFLNITCTGGKIKGGKITVGGETDSAESLSFTTCKVLGPNNESTVCLVKNVGGTNGTIATGSLTSKLKTVGTSAYDVFTPVGANFVEIRITECALEGTYKVTGTASLKVLTSGLALTNEDEANATIAGAAETKLFFGARESFLDGKVDLSLASGRKFGVDP